MTYVVQKTEEQPRRAYHSGFGDTYDAQLCTFFLRSAESRGKAKRKTQQFCRLRSKGMLNRREETKTQQVCGQVTKTGQAKSAGTGRRNYHNFSAWLRKWSDLNQWLEGQGSTPTQARTHRCWSKVGQPEKSRQGRGTLKLSEQ